MVLGSQCSYSGCGPWVTCLGSCSLALRHCRLSSSRPPRDGCSQLPIKTNSGFQFLWDAFPSLWTSSFHPGYVLWHPCTCHFLGKHSHSFFKALPHTYIMSSRTLCTLLSDLLWVTLFVHCITSVSPLVIRTSSVSSCQGPSSSALCTQHPNRGLLIGKVPRNICRVRR